MSRKQESKVFRIKRFEIGMNVLVQLVLLGALLAMVNYLAFKHYKRWDFSREGKYALSEQTRKILGALEKPLRAIVLFSPGAPGGEVYRDVDSLLKEYQYAGRGKVTVEFIDQYKNFTRARDLQAKYKFGTQENLVILDYADRSKFVTGMDMAEYDNSGAMFGQPPRVKAFKGEQAITAALLELVEEKTHRIAFTTGHGEVSIEGEGDLSTLLLYLARQNAKPETLNLAGLDEIAKNIGVVVIAGPKYDFTEREERILRAYWEKQGRLVVALDPGASTPRLKEFLRELGVNPRGDRVLRTVPMGPVIGILKDVQGSFESGSPITKNLADATALLLGGTQSLGLDPESARSRGLSLTPLIRAGEGFWGEVGDALSEDVPIEFEAGKDHAAPLDLAVSVEKGALPDGTVKVNPSRLIALGNAAFLRNEALTEPNVDFLLAGINWLLDRQDLIAIAPKEVRPFTLNLTDAQLRTILIVGMLVMPLVAGVIGWAVWWTRRR